MKRIKKARVFTLPVNSAFFDTPEVGKLRTAGRMEAVVTYLAIMSLIRGRKTYFVRCDSALYYDLEEMTRRYPAEIEGDMDKLVECGFFDKEMYIKKGILTSRRLQNGYRRRKDAEPIDENYLIVTDADRRRAAREAKKAAFVALIEKKLMESMAVKGQAVLHGADSDARADGLPNASAYCPTQRE